MKHNNIYLSKADIECLLNWYIYMEGESIPDDADMKLKEKLNKIHER
jgi:hypothetical protein